MAKTDKPNILVIWGDDIGIWNLSCYSGGMMGYRTPNIDRIANEGMRFTDSYGEQSCTAGRAAFITGQSVFRTGLSKVGFPGAPVGLQAEDPTIAELLKPLGYATGQFGKNHFGDQNRFLPTVHGFDEFYGNLYHLNAEEDPEDEDYPKDPKFKARFGPRGVLRCKATDKDDKTDEPRWGRSASRRSRTPARSPASAWRPATTTSSLPRRTSSSASTTPASRSSCGSTPPTCTCGPTPSPRAAARRASTSRSITTPWSTTTRTSARCSTTSTSSASPTTPSSCTRPTTGRT